MKINLILILSLIMSAFSFAMEPNYQDSVESTTGEYEILEAHLKDRQMKMINSRYDDARITFSSDAVQALSTEEKKLSPEKQVWLAIQKNSATDLQALLGKGKSKLATIKDEFGRTPLHIAASNFKSKLIPLLVAAGAEVNENSNDWEATPLVKAVDCSWGRVTEQNDTVLTLLALGADPRIKDKQGRSALVVAQLYGSQRDFVPALKAQMNSRV